MPTAQTPSNPSATVVATPRAEAQRIYRSIFRSDPTDRIIERFIAASDRLNARVPPEALTRYRNALARVHDLEALEVACRYRKRLTLLSDKFRIMAYIAETFPENQHFFVKEHPGLTRSIVALGWGACRTLYKLLKGFGLLARVDDV